MNIINDDTIQFFQTFFYIFSLAFKIIEIILFSLPREEDENFHPPITIEQGINKSTVHWTALCKLFLSR